MIIIINKKFIISNEKVNIKQLKKTQNGKSQSKTILNKSKSKKLTERAKNFN